MKAKINGIELEGDVDEIVEIIGKINVKKTDETIKDTIIVNKPITYKHKNSRINWIEVFENAKERYVKGKKSISECLRLQLKRKCKISGSEIKRFRRYLIENNIPIERRRTKKYNIKKSKQNVVPKNDLRTIRMHFINSKSNYLMKQYNYSREKACAMASQEWNNLKYKKQNKTLKILDDENLNKILLDILNNVIHRKFKMSFIKDGYALGQETIKQWSEFIRMLITESDKISKYFNVKNKFKLTSTLEFYYE